jgi:hypothetical protein
MSQGSNEWISAIQSRAGAPELAGTGPSAQAFPAYPDDFVVECVGDCGDFDAHLLRDKSRREVTIMVGNLSQLVNTKFQEIGHSRLPFHFAAKGYEKFVKKSLSLIIR